MSPQEPCPPDNASDADTCDAIACQQQSACAEGATLADCEYRKQLQQFRAQLHAPGRPTGPRTPEGKAISSRNALKDGFRSAKMIVPAGMEAEKDALVERLIRAYRPDGEAEILVFENLVHDHWNLYRIRLKLASLAADGIDPLGKPESHKEYDRLARYEARAQSSIRSNLRELRILQTNRVARQALPETIEEDLPPIAKVSAVLSLAKRTPKTFAAPSLDTLADRLRAERDGLSPEKGPRPIQFTDFLTPEERKKYNR